MWMAALPLAHIPIHDLCSEADVDRSLLDMSRGSDISLTLKRGLLMCVLYL